MSDFYEVLFSLQKQESQKGAFYTDEEGRVRFIGGPGSGGGGSGSGGSSDSANIRRGLNALSKDVNETFGVYDNFNAFVNSIQSTGGFDSVKNQNGLTWYQLGNENYIVEGNRVYTSYAYHGRNMFNQLQTTEGRTELAKIGNEIADFR